MKLPDPKQQVFAGRSAAPPRAGTGARKYRAARTGERLLFATGMALLAILVVSYIHRFASLHDSMKDFENARQERSLQPAAMPPAPHAPATAAGSASDVPDLPPPAGRTAGAAHRGGKAPLAILRIPKIKLEVPVLNGTDEITLNRGVGQIPGTAAPGEQGNIGIAGHRDSFFRELKDLNKGDAIELETTGGSQIYIVDLILVTDATNVSVLRPRGTQSLTLVTCYPFTYIGPAPRRFVVQASLK
jgi:sortase A